MLRLRIGKIGLALALVFASAGPLHAQNRFVLDSLRTALAYAKTDSSKVAIYNELAWQFRYTNLDSSLYLSLKAQRIAKQMGNASLEAHTLRTQANIYRYQGRYQQSLELLLKAMVMTEESNDKKGRAESYGYLGGLYIIFGDTLTGERYQNENLKLRRELGDKLGEHGVHITLGKQALDKRKNEIAVSHFVIAFQLAQELRNAQGQAIALNCLGQADLAIGRNKEALQHFTASLEIKQKLNDVRGMAFSCLGLAQTHMALKHYATAKPYAEKALAYAEKGNYKPETRDALWVLFNLSQKMGNPNLELVYLKRYTELYKMLEQEGNAIKITGIQSIYQSRNKEAENKALRQKEAYQAAMLDSQRLWIVLLLTILLAILGIGFVFYRLYRERERTQLIMANQQKELKEVNNELNDTLTYLRETQNQLIKQEKLASLGQLVSGIAHEINTPISAVKSNGVSLKDSLPPLLSSIPVMLLKLSAHELALLQDFVRGALLEQNSFTTREEREVRKDLETELTFVGITDARSIANLLVLTRVVTNISPYYGILKSQDATVFLEVAWAFIRIFRSADNILLAAEKTNRMVGALRNYVQLSEKTGKVETNIAATIDSVLAFHEHTLKNRITLIKNYKYNEPILSMPEALEHVWNNLVHNAILAMEGSGTLLIEVEQMGDWAAVSFADNGRGLADLADDQVFEPFFTTREQGEGTGLGLFISKRIIEEIHQGRIEITRLAKGTRFTVLLPIRISPAATLVAARQ